MPRKQAKRPTNSTARHTGRTKYRTESPTSAENDSFVERQSFRKGGAFSTSPEEPGSQQTDWRVGVVMVICLPISFLIFWKITLPAVWWVVSTIIGSDITQKLGFFKQDIISMMTSECPLWIPAKHQAYLMDRSNDNILRVSDISKEDFQKIVRRGEPVIVTDALRDWESFGLYNCGYFMRQFPDAEYFDWQGQKQMTLGNITNRPSYTGLQCASGYMETNWDSNLKYSKEWLAKMPAPYFLPEDAYTSVPFHKDEEPSVTGFIGVPGTGVAPHLDETCDTIMTVQLAGVKNWSLSWPVKEGDNIRWSKPIVFTIYPGEAMLWYVAMRHHTEVIQDCSLSFSFLLNTPAPTDYFHRLSQDLSSVSREERDALFVETGASELDFFEKCSIVEDRGMTFIT